MAARNEPPWFASVRDIIMLILLLYYECSIIAVGAPADDALVLLKFKTSLEDFSGTLNNWKEGSVPCPNDGKGAQWVGLMCWDGMVLGLRMNNMNLRGVIDVGTLVGLPNLRSLGFMNNLFEGPMPEVRKLPTLRSIFLSGNRSSGEIPADAFERMGWLSRVHLARNDFSGQIPTSLAGLGRLTELHLEENRFTGEIPDLKQPDLRAVNVSYNELDGEIPSRLSEMDASSFEGNNDLCGKPLDYICASETSLIVVRIVTGVAMVLMIIVIIVSRRHRKASKAKALIPPTTNEKLLAGRGGDVQVESGGSLAGSSSGSGHKKSAGKDHSHGKLLFLTEDRKEFDLRDLMKASAQVLASGSFGSSYKAALLNGPLVVVKRYRDMNGIGREDFHEHMRRLGRLKHPNLQPIVSYNYRKEEKLLVTDFVDNGSLVQLLHGYQCPQRRMLDWPIRLKIIKGVARGLSYLYNELPILTLPHGHLKSSNVLLDNSFEPKLTDYALAPVMNTKHAIQLMVAYKSPEYVKNGQVTKKSDVWSLGILMLEIMTGKFPANNLAPGKGDTELATWVDSIARAERGDGVFDSDIDGAKNGEMWKLLDIGVRCCEEDVDKRWELEEAVEKIEEVREL